MGSSEEKVVAVIMVGGPIKGTRFRPLSFNTPKPLFPLAGQPMVHHHISACKRISKNLAQIFLIGFYGEREFALYVSSISNELRVTVRYLKEDEPHGSAGGLYYFRDLIMEDSPSHIFLLNCDVSCNFPLANMLDAHLSFGGMGTLLVIKVSAESANQFGQLVADPFTQRNPRLLYAILAEGDCNAKLGITILGEAVTVEDEVVVINSIVPPHKTLNMSVQEEIIL